MSITPNFLVILLQAIPFLLTIFALQKIIFAPMLAYLSERLAATEGARKEAAALQAQATSQTEAYEQKLAAARAEISALRATRRAEAMLVYRARIDQARRDADQRISAALEGIRADEATARASLKGSSLALAEQIADQLLPRAAG